MRRAERSAPTHGLAAIARVPFNPIAESSRKSDRDECKYGAGGSFAPRPMSPGRPGARLGLPCTESVFGIEIGASGSPLGWRPCCAVSSANSSGGDESQDWPPVSDGESSDPQEAETTPAPYGPVSLL